MNEKNDVMGAVMHLQRAMKRGPMGGMHGHHKGCNGDGPKGKHCGMHGGPETGCKHGEGHHGGGCHGGKRPNMGAGRVISALSGKESISTSELMEMLDLRPSSMSELLSKMEEQGLIVRTASSEDKRVNLVSLTEEGKVLEEKISEERAARLAVFSACFTEDEAAEFCRLCEKLSSHLESLAMVKG